MSHSRNPGYIPGNHWAVCDDCGRDQRQKQLRKTWDNFWMCSRCWTPKHEGDMIQPIRQERPAMEPVRPPPQDLTTDFELGDHIAAIPSGTFTSNNNTL